ncbi:MAG: cysteine dioxygenase family protein [Chloroflexi bacterium]|nr:cysteine dioxygenase family protein [Chloroflexota bacterium]
MSLPYDIEALTQDVALIVRRASDDLARVEAIKPLLARWMPRCEGLRPEHREPCDGRACGHLLHSAADGSFFIISVVFPPGTSSGVHYHGSWGVIGTLAGVDEETKYVRPDGPAAVAVGQSCELTKTDVLRLPPGGVTHLLPPAEGFHRVRAVGDQAGVSLHILGGSPDSHPHFLCDSAARRLVDFPMRLLLDRAPMTGG